jgi:hypothetical protein
MMVSEQDEMDSLHGRIESMRTEHRDLDLVIDRLTLEGSPDQLVLRRLKKRKLLLKDQIAQLERQLEPDIPA